MPQVPRWAILVSVGVLFCLMVLKRVIERGLASSVTDGGKIREGMVLGVVGKMGYGKTSFIVSNYAIPALRAGRTVVANFTIRADDLPGQCVRLEAHQFGADLLGIGSSLNTDPTTGEPVTGWFYDTACTCGKDGNDRVQCGCNAAVVVLDEAHLFVPASNSRPLPVELMQWFTMARKNHVQVIWATQYWKWVHSAARRLSSQIWVCEPGKMRGNHVANCHEPFALEQRESVPLASIKYQITESLVSRYDSWEVVVPAATAFEIAGQMKRKKLPAGGVPVARSALAPVLEHPTAASRPAPS
jgi:Zonular occludens toxin (Zot)